MVNFNGKLLQKDSKFLNHKNRGIRFGDALFEELRVVDNEIIFWEDHYLKLMASMRILRMSIPMEFTMEFLQEEILKTCAIHNQHKNGSLVRFTVFRNSGGDYLPESNTISYVMECSPLSSSFYLLKDEPYEIELFKDFLVNNDLTSTLQTNNSIIRVVGSVYAQENGYQNCILLNGSKMVVEGLNGAVFMVNNNVITTPSIKEGCLNSILRKKIIDLCTKLEAYEIHEKSISPFDLQKADELFIVNVKNGIIPITKYRKKLFGTTVATDLLGKLNAAAKLS